MNSKLGTVWQQWNCQNSLQKMMIFDYWQEEKTSPSRVRHFLRLVDKVNCSLLDWQEHSTSCTWWQFWWFPKICQGTWTLEIHQYFCSRPSDRLSIFPIANFWYNITWSDLKSIIHKHNHIKSNLLPHLFSFRTVAFHSTFGLCFLWCVLFCIFWNLYSL